jgi:hypothetical protein
MKMTGETEVFGEKPVPVPLCPSQIPHGLTRGSNPGLRGEWPATNSLSHGTALLTTVYNIQKQLSSGLCPSSWIKYKITTFRKLVLLPSSGDGRRDTYPLSRCLPFHHLKTEEEPATETSLFYILSKTMDQVRKTVVSQC